MKTLFLSAACAALISSTSYGQNAPDRRGFIGLSLGPSAPIGNFAGEWSPGGPGGGAVAGYNNNLLSLSWRFSDPWGVAGVASYGEYWIGRDTEDDWWQVAGLVAGPMYSLRVTPRMRLDLKAMIGMVVLTEVVDSYSSDARIGPGWALDTRATLRYDVFSRWSAFTDVGVMNGSVSLGDGTQKTVGLLNASFGVAFRPVW